MSTEIDDLIIAALAGASSLSATVAGRVHADEAPASTALPYVVVQLITSTPTYESGQEGPGAPSGLDDVEVQVSVFAATRAESKSLSRLAEAALNDVQLASSHLYLRRANRWTELDPFKSPSGGDVWRTITTFRSILELE